MGSLIIVGVVLQTFLIVSVEWSRRLVKLEDRFAATSKVVARGPCDDESTVGQVKNFQKDYKRTRRRVPMYGSKARKRHYRAFHDAALNVSCDVNFVTLATTEKKFLHQSSMAARENLNLAFGLASTVLACMVLLLVLPLLKSAGEDESEINDGADDGETEAQDDATIHIDDDLEIIEANDKARSLFGGPLKKARIDSVIAISRAQLIEHSAKEHRVPLASGGGKSFSVTVHALDASLGSSIGSSMTDHPPRRIRRLTIRPLEPPAQQDKLKIQHLVLAQFAHEIRNKFTPAATTLEQILRSTRQPHVSESGTDERTDDDSGKKKPAVTIVPPTTKKKGSTTTEEIKVTSNRRIILPSSEVTSLDDIKDAIALLREAEALIATRLALHSMTAGEYMSKPETRDLTKLMSRRMRHVGELGKAGVEFKSSYIDETTTKPRIFVRFDVELWTYIVDALLYNARKHTVRGAVELQFVGRKNDLLEFAVIDTGSGVPETIQRTIFEDGGVAVGEDRGVGLGLVSARRFAAAVGGGVWLHSTSTDTAETGSEFRFSLPGTIVDLPVGTSSIDDDGFSPALFASANESSETQERRKKRTTLESFVPKDLHVVIVDDSRVIRKSIVAKFSAVARHIAGTFSFAEYESVEAILPVISSFQARPHLVITVDENLNSPLTGSHLISALVDANCAGLIASASGDPDIASHHLDLGANFVLGKPLPTTDHIIHLLANAFRDRGDVVSYLP